MYQQKLVIERILSDKYFVCLLTIDSFVDYHYSELTILHTAKEHSGNYTCAPQNSQPASTVIHIFKGKRVYAECTISITILEEPINIHLK